MPKNHINRIEFDDWATTGFHEYASETILVDFIGKRLKFLVRYDGKQFRVILGDEILYNGHDFDKAASAYNSAG